MRVTLFLFSFLLACGSSPSSSQQVDTADPGPVDAGSLSSSPTGEFADAGTLAPNLPADPVPDAGTSSDPVPVDAGPSEDAGATCVACFPQSVVFGPTGGRVAYRDESTLSTCNEFSLSRTIYSVGASILTCSNQVAACDASTGVTTVQVLDALDHPDVASALTAAASGSVFFGQDNRYIDVPAYTISVNGISFGIGNDCGVASRTCPTPIPTGIAALRTLLVNLTEQQRAVGDCATTFGS